jgi:hypothetical protein
VTILVLCWAMVAAAALVALAYGWGVVPAWLAGWGLGVIGAWLIANAILRR